MPNIIERVLAGIALIIMSPVLAVIAALIRFQSGPPVLFRQVRVGQYGRPFQILKFRTMDPSRGPKIMVTAASDPRVTPLGRRLRASKLDELPQLWNVVRGDMAIVGPRPEVPVNAVSWPKASRDVILSVRPGLADPMIRELRREEELLASQPNPNDYYLKVWLPHKEETYVDYVGRKSLRKDVEVVVTTVASVLWH